MNEYSFIGLYKQLFTFIGLLIVRMRGDNKRGKILEAAVKVFARNGFYQSKVSEIAREAEVADGTIYLYFHNKDDILINLFEEEMTRIIEAMKAVIAREDDPVRQLEKFAQAHLGLVKRNKELAEVIQVEIRQSSKFMKEYDNKKFAEYPGPDFDYYSGRPVERRLSRGHPSRHRQTGRLRSPGRAFPAAGPLPLEGTLHSPGRPAAQRLFPGRHDRRP